MTQLSPAAIKPHLAIAAGDTGDDALIADYIAAAEGHVVKHTRRDLDTEFPDGWPAPILQAVRLLVAHWYAHREAVALGQAAKVPFGVDAMLAPWRDLGA
jgi:hypothetical protein